ncbi:MAG: ribonucleoside reductase class II [Anaerolineae bacterium]|nr:ribonucleoside reductase class II [Anaerolineae bacterium]
MTTEIELPPNALEVLQRRYLRRGPDGQIAETVDEMFHRLAAHVAAAEAEWGGDVEAAQNLFYHLVVSLRFLPNSPAFTGAGTPLGQLAACFVLPIADDMGKEQDGIFQTLRNAALIHQTGGGTGFSFSRLRPRGALIQSSGGRATGPVGFMQVYDTACQIVSEGGTRRGANMAVLRVDHPDIEEFVTCKSKEQAISNFNISVGVTDAFMRALGKDTTVDLVSPQDGSTWRTIRAQDLFDQIVAGAYRNGEPGMLFLDTVNRDNPCPHLGEYEATNPCVVGDTWVTTENGPAQVQHLVGQATRLLLDGDFHIASDEGFFCTGEREVIEIHTHRGFRIQLTPDHPIRKVTHMTPYRLESTWQRAGALTVGDKVLLSDNRHTSWEGRGTWEEGYLLGLLVGDGTITVGKAIISVWGEGAGSESVRQNVLRLVADLSQREDFQGFMWLEERREARLELKSVYDIACSYGLSEEFKGISAEIEQTGATFHRGFLRGLFDADGTVTGTQEKGVSVRLAQSDLALLEATQRMLHRLGIVSTIYRERRRPGEKRMPDGKGGMREHPIKAQHELVISCENIVHFAHRIGFSDVEKSSRLEERLAAYQRRMNRERFVDKVVAIKPCEKAAVYDVQIPDRHAFDANGFHVHNCGEQPLLPYENCCLGSVNLARHVQTLGGQAAIDWPKLQETVEGAVRFLDDVVEANAYVPAVPQLKEAAQRTRRIGLGMMGLGDAMYHLGVQYGSDEGQELAAQLIEFIRYHAMQASIRLAQERGPFPAIAGSLYDPHDLRWTPPHPITPHRRLEQWGRPALDWQAVVAGIQQHGIRNAAQTTVAPTGTIATIAGCEAYGCEPVFALVYVRRVKEAGGDVDLEYTSPLFLRALERAGLDPTTRKRIVEQVALTGSCQGIGEVPPAIREVFVVAGDVPADEHIRTQAALQAFVDASISKTINFPTTATPDDVAQAFRLAWRLGCKGLTVYVTGSREWAVLETEETRREKKARELARSTQVRPRPQILEGRTYRIVTPLGTAYATVNQTTEEEPFEVFLNVGRAGSDTAAVAEAIGRLISLILRIPSTLSPSRRLRQVVEQLKGIGGGRPLGFGRDRVWSLPDGVAKVLAVHLGLAEPSTGEAPAAPPLFTAGDLCPDCGHAALVNEEGCRRCYACGYSEC